MTATPPPAPRQQDVVPPQEWGQDALFWTHLKLFNSHFVNLESCPGQADHLLRGLARPVSCAHLVGVLVAVKSKSRFCAFTVDDGTELVDCLWWEHDSAAAHPRALPALGATVRCIGKMDFPPVRAKSGQKFVRRRQLVLSGAVERVDDPNEELLHWVECMRLWPTYAEPRPASWRTEPAASRPRLLLESEAALEELVNQVVNKVPAMPLVRPTNAYWKLLPDTPLRLTCFDLERLFEESAIQRALSRVPEEGERKQALKEAVLKLVRTGYAYVHVEDALYGVINHDHCMAPAIIKVLATSRQKRFAKSRLVAEVREREPQLKMVSQDRFERSINMLLRDSVLYECDDAYALVVVE